MYVFIHSLYSSTKYMLPPDNAECKYCEDIMLLFSFYFVSSLLVLYDVLPSSPFGPPFTNQKYLQLPQQTSCTTSLLTAAYLPGLAGVQGSYDPLLSGKKKIRIVILFAYLFSW